jgi:hypothetical protein
VTEARSLAEIAVAEHQIAYAYGVLGARLPARLRERAVADRTAHQASAERLAVVLRQRGEPPVPAALAYAVPAGSEATVTARLENDLAVLWRDLVATTTDPDLRTLAVAGLIECSRRAAGWSPSVPGAFPGEVPSDAPVPQQSG